MAAKSIFNPTWIQGSTQQDRIAAAQQQGFVVDQSLADGSVQMVKKKKFSMVTFLILLFVFGLGLIYLIYYLFVKKDTYIVLPKKAS
jgi:hypothetical protein